MYTALQYAMLIVVFFLLFSPVFLPHRGDLPVHHNEMANNRHSNSNQNMNQNSHSDGGGHGTFNNNGYNGGNSGGNSGFGGNGGNNGYVSPIMSPRKNLNRGAQNQNMNQNDGGGGGGGNIANLLKLNIGGGGGGGGGGGDNYSNAGDDYNEPNQQEFNNRGGGGGGGGAVSQEEYDNLSKLCERLLSQQEQQAEELRVSLVSCTALHCTVLHSSGCFLSRAHVVGILVWFYYSYYLRKKTEARTLIVWVCQVFVVPSAASQDVLDHGWAVVHEARLAHLTMDMTATALVQQTISEPMRLVE